MKFEGKTVLSGINPSSSKGLHLGNYLGAAKNHVDMQSKAGHAYYFIADYHSLNTVFDRDQLKSNVINTYLDYMAFGLKPEQKNVTFFIESAIPEIAELNIILNNVVSMAELKRMHAYKDKFSDGIEEDAINHGLFNYPVLMASDILIFDTDVVPVGEDQKQHVEITRAIVRHFNNKYGVKTFKEPEVYVKEETARIPGTDGKNKMSKSVGNDISVFAAEKKIRKQINSTKTDPNRIHPDDPGDPDKNVIFKYMELLEFDQNKLEEYKERYKEGSVGDVQIKKDFADHYLDYFSEIRKRRSELESNMRDVKKIIADNNGEAREIAKEKIDKVRNKIGLRSRDEDKSFVSFQDFQNFDIRVCKILRVENHPNADKLLKLIVDDGEGERQVLAGIAEQIESREELVGMMIPVIVNMKPANMRGEVSEGMIIASDNDEGIVFLTPDDAIKSGAKVH
jgi:tryptophanyl-tRNA synthetase